MSSLNPSYINSEQPQWRQVIGKVDTWVHDSQPEQEVEIRFYSCKDCKVQQVSYHSLSEIPEKGIFAATEEEKKVHSICSCGKEFRRWHSPE